MPAIPKMLFSDFDGTIKPYKGPVAKADIEAFSRLGRLGSKRVVATGRSLAAFDRDWDRRMEMDYLIFSSGLGACLWGPDGAGELLFSHRFAPDVCQKALEACLALKRGFYAFRPPPECHLFVHQPPEGRPPTVGDARRLELYRDYATFYQGGPIGPRGQFLITAPAAEIDEVKREFEELSPGLSLIYSTSPMGDASVWLEIFPPGVSKGSAAKWLADKLSFQAADCLAIGNDFNDLDLLAWAGTAYLTADASPALRSLYPALPASTQAPLASLVSRLIGPAS
ncbi:MAG: Cof-type HAD-IIB family hydrolase [Deltaproteobacteria bacterium]|nr:Cof-type HAD-IIB family hydrolase [Deltaproteobacteria bacterium]